MTVIRFIFILLIISTFSFAQGTEPLNFIEVSNESEWQKVFEQAQAEDKVVFVDVYTDWCGYCHKLDKEVYTDSNVVDYFEENFVNVKFDAETEFGYGKAFKYSVDGYPTLLFLTTNEEVYQEIGGFVPAPTLMAYARDVQGSWQALPELEVKYESGVITSDETIEYIGVLEKRDEEKAATVAAKYINNLTDKDYQEIENLWLVSRFENHLTSKPYYYISTHKEEIIEEHGQSEYEDYMKAVYNDNLEKAIRYGELRIVDQLITEVLPEFIEVGNQPEMAYVTKSIYYGQREDYSAYILENNAYINNHLLQEQKQEWLVQEALEIINNFEAEEMYQHALDLLTQSIQMDRESFEAHALAGYTYGLLKDYNNANAFLNKAKKFAGTNEEQIEIVSGLKEAVQAMQG